LHSIAAIKGERPDALVVEPKLSREKEKEPLARGPTGTPSLAYKLQVERFDVLAREQRNPC
jgi:hypothetical protein